VTTRPPPRHDRYVPPASYAHHTGELPAETRTPSRPTVEPRPAAVPIHLADRIATQLAADEFTCTWRQNATRCMERAGTVVALADIPRSTCRRHALPFRRLGASPLR
jgi:hypothetical protein